MAERTGGQVVVGGQAVLDGVMMRAGDRWSLATRRPDGSIEVTTHRAPEWAGRFAAVPLVRGIAALAETVALGGRATVLASRRREGVDHARPGEIVAVAIGGALAVALFGVAPTAVAHQVTSGWTFHLLEAVLRIGALVGYLALLGSSAAIDDVWRYHGAEHRVVNAHEAGERPSVRAASRYPTAHRRCGTTFLLLVAVLAVAVHAAIGEPPTALLLASRLLALPLIAAVAYEVIRVAGRPGAPLVVRALTAPGLAFQRLTTREPSPAHLEVAVAALAAVVPGPVREVARAA